MLPSQTDEDDEYRAYAGDSVTMLYHPVETAEVLESDRGNNLRNQGPANKLIHNEAFEIQHHSRRPSMNIE